MRCLQYMFHENTSREHITKTHHKNTFRQQGCTSKSEPVGKQRCTANLAEREGFEPPDPFGCHLSCRNQGCKPSVFQALSGSGTAPLLSSVNVHKIVIITATIVKQANNPVKIDEILRKWVFTTHRQA